MSPSRAAGLLLLEPYIDDKTYDLEVLEASNSGGMLH